MNAIASLFHSKDTVISGFVSVLFGIKGFSPKYSLLYLHTVSSFQVRKAVIA